MSGKKALKTQSFLKRSSTLIMKDTKVKTIKTGRTVGGVNDYIKVMKKDPESDREDESKFTTEVI
jgi:hypothetical protein